MELFDLVVAQTLNGSGGGGGGSSDFSTATVTLVNQSNESVACSVYSSFGDMSYSWGFPPNTLPDYVSEIYPEIAPSSNEAVELVLYKGHSLITFDNGLSVEITGNIEYLTDESGSALYDVTGDGTITVTAKL